MEKNIKTNQAILYSGEVHIYYETGKTFTHINKHNTGEIPLFTAITLALGERMEDAKEFIPKYLMGVQDVGGGIFENCFNINALVQDRKYFLDDVLSNGSANNRIRYTFVVHLSSILPDKIVTRLQLKNKQNQICATIDLEQAEQINTNLTASLLIYWDLKFADAGVETPVI